MARRETIDDEQKSYGAVFLLGVALLLLGAVWTVWDDNIFRRPWKKYQSEFHNLEVGKVRASIAAEDTRLGADPTYQQLVKDLAAAQESVARGENAQRLAQLEKQRAAAQIRFGEQDFALRLVKSRLEEAWYDYEHAVLSGLPEDGPKAVIADLDRHKAETDTHLAQAQAEVDRIDKEAAEVRSVVQTLEKKKRELESQKELLQTKLDGLLLHVGPLEFTKIPKIQQVVLNEFDRNAYDQPVARVDRCESCHLGATQAGYEDDPNPHKSHPNRAVLIGKHEGFGCTTCHQGQGPAVNSIATAHGTVRFWEHSLLTGEEIQSSCIGCHTDVHVPGAEQIARGEQLFEQLGCHGCHLVEHYGDLDKVGPYLRRIKAKVEPGWLVRWVQNPHEFRPSTKMPNFLLNRDQATAVAAYLLQASGKEADEWLASHPGATTKVDAADAAQVAHGRELADSLGCRGCHGFAPGESPAHLGENKDIAPNLSNVAEKTDARWLYHWVKEPRGYSPVSRMPSLRLSDEEAAALTSYLLTLGNPQRADAELSAQLQSPEVIKKGEGLVRKYGCGGCHDIPGMEAESRIGVELTVFGAKKLEELFFGYRKDIPIAWSDWTYNKIKTPRTYETERIEQLMPQFDLADPDIRALMLFLKSRTEHHVPAQYRPTHLEREAKMVEGRRVVRKYNCVGCHVIEKGGGAILARYEDKPTLAPPVLNGEGAKVQPDWMFSFLKHPVSLRPWLKVRMPTFNMSDREATALIDYFMAQEAREIPFVYFDTAKIPASHIEAGRTLMSPDYLNCFSCHQQGDKKPEGPEEGWAPDLTLAKHRLNPDWIIKWLSDPQAVQPGTKMPSFYNLTDDSPDGPEDVLDGNDRLQIEALRDYILTLGEAKPVVAAAANNDGAGRN